MIPVPLELPLKTGEAGKLAEIVFQIAEGHRLSDAVRSRIGSRIAALQLSSIRAFPGSLQRDPIHHSTYYIALDSMAPRAEALLLRIGLESSPSSGLFPNSLLIGRVRTGANQEAVVNAIPFGPADEGNIRKFAEQVDPSFLPQSGRRLRAVAANVSNARERWHATVWHAIRAGWREGWTAILRIRSLDEAVTLPRVAADFTRFSAGGHMEQIGAEKIYDAVQAVLARKHFDFEIDLTGSPTDTTPEQVVHYLRTFRAGNRPVQSIAPHLTPAPSADFESRLARLHEAARQFNAILTLDSAALADPELQALIGRITGGRVNYGIPREPHEIGSTR